MPGIPQVNQASDTEEWERMLVLALDGNRADVVKTITQQHIPESHVVVEAFVDACSKGSVDCIRVMMDWRPELVSDGRAYDKASDSVKNVLEQSLIQAVAKGDLDSTRALLQGHVRPTEECDLLHWAVNFGQGYEMLQLLVQAGWDINKMDKDGRNPLHEAIRNKQFDSAEALAMLGADTSLVNSQGHSSCHLYPKLKNINTNIPNGNMHVIDEHQKLKFQLEENEIALNTLKNTIEMLLEDQGVLKYIHQMQNDFQALSMQLERVQDSNSNLQSLYVQCDTQLVNLQKENTVLRRSRSSSENEAGELELLRKERDELADDLEAERRLRFTEARLHLKHNEHLRNELATTKKQLEKIASCDSVKYDEEIPNGGGIFNSLYYSIFGDDGASVSSSDEDENLL